MEGVDPEIPCVPSHLIPMVRYLARGRSLMLTIMFANDADTDLKIKTLVLHECPLWKNAAIGRELNREGIKVVMNDFVKSGHGEWEDPALRTRCRILWRRPEQLASDLYDWAVANGYINSVCTLYELHSGEDVNGMSFQGADEELLRRALGILENQGKCTIFQGETSSEDGIKFF
ncbi:hypothetical protein ACHAWF_001237 [Thalassiosira exigua]